MSSEHQKKTAFLRRCISYEESNEGRQLDEHMTQIQRNERSLRRATWLAALVVALVAGGFSYMVFLIEDFPNHISQFAAEFISKTVCTLGIGSMVSLLAVGLLGIRNRRDLNLRREECRRLVTALLERQLGKTPAPPGNGELKTQGHNHVPKQADHIRNGEHKPAVHAIVGVDSPDC